MQTRYLTSIQDASKFSAYDGPEIALVGRSNSGKSSFLNGLTNVKGIAKTSQTPGRTQMINIFLWEIAKDQKIYLADFPGYGFSQVNRNTKKMWQGTLHEYLLDKPLAFVLFLMDVRREATDEEVEFLKSFHHKKLLIATKTDKIGKNQAQSQLKRILSYLERRKVLIEKGFLVSNQNKEGLDEVRNYLIDACCLSRLSQTSQS